MVYVLQVRKQLLLSYHLNCLINYHPNELFSGFLYFSELPVLLFLKCSVNDLHLKML